MKRPNIRLPAEDHQRTDELSNEEFYRYSLWETPELHGLVQVATVGNT
ncbi:hypothetical protein VCX44_21590 [Aeromonas caviae]|uniref:Uncharacterized protein n=1 Tax=Aeromonas caviae TaxID=648 RepID=A0ABU5WBU4_AERCA|nr:hypothetical protein [Aeromonas caviae]MEA9438324.1 hypothetical protein [Aeromonas caviae]